MVLSEESSFPFDEMVARVTGEYTMFLAALSGRMAALKGPGVEVTPSALSDLSRDALGLWASFMGSATREIEEYTREVTTDGSDALVQSVVERKLELVAKMRRMVSENVSRTIQAMRVGSLSLGDMLQGSAGAVGMLLQRNLGAAKHKVTDTSGRQWDAEKLMKVIVRDFGYQSWVDGEIDTLRASGAVAASAVHLNGPYIVSQDNFSIAEPIAGLMSFEDVRDQLFHINSTAWVWRYVPS